MDQIDRSNLCIDHVAVAVTDLDEAARWYSSLGFYELERRITTGQKTSMQSAVMISGSSIVVLVQGLNKECQVQKFIDNFGVGVQHIAFRVEDLDLALTTLAAHRIEPEFTIIEGDGIRQVFLKRESGSGVRIELIQRNGGNFSDSTIEQLYRAFEEAGAY